MAMAYVHEREGPVTPCWVRAFRSPFECRISCRATKPLRVRLGAVRLLGLGGARRVRLTGGAAGFSCFLRRDPGRRNAARFDVRGESGLLCRLPGASTPDPAAREIAVPRARAGSSRTP